MFQNPEVLAYVASAIGVAMVVPQIHRIVRNPAMGGVSPWTWAVTVVSCTVWISYGVRTASMPQVPGNILLVAGAASVVLLVPVAWRPRTRALVLAVLTTGVVLVSLRLPAEAVGFLALGIGLFGMWPQVFETVWLRRGMGPSAVSLTSTSLKLASQSLWLTFAFLTADRPVLVAATMLLATNTIVAVVERSRRRAVASGQATAPKPTLVGAEV
jgi:uncharacterized protein with PQ loop repeat